MAEVETAVPIGERFALVTLDGLSGGQVKFHVSIAVSAPDELSKSDIEVTASAGGTPLELTEGPADGPLPAVGARGITAYAQYVFANPGDSSPVVVTVAIGGQSADFELSGAPPVA